MYQIETRENNKPFRLGNFEKDFLTLGEKKKIKKKSPPKAIEQMTTNIEIHRARSNLKKQKGKKLSPLLRGNMKTQSSRLEDSPEIHKYIDRKEKLTTTMDLGTMMMAFRRLL